MGSTTQYFTVTNPYDENVIISQIKVAGGDMSSFRLNINGNEGNEVFDVGIPPNDSIKIGVTFSGESGLGSVPGNLRITWDSGEVDIALKGTLVQEALATQ